MVSHIVVLDAVQVSDEFEMLISSLVESLPDSLQPKMHVMPRNDVHVSLSRTVPIRHYWIDPLVDQLKDKLNTKERFVTRMHELVKRSYSQSYYSITY